MTNVLGIDVSRWQDDNSTPQKMDFHRARYAGAKFVFIKVSERGGVDEDFLINWRNAKDAGIPRGGYHFLRWDLSGSMQARIFCGLLKGDPGELPPVADFEAPPRVDLSGVLRYPSNALLAQFLEEVESILGIRPMIYTSPGFWNSHGKIRGTSIFDPKWAYYNLWVAHYGVDKPMVPKPWKTWTFWQYSSTGPGPAFGAESKGLDMNHFNGNEEQFRAFLGANNPLPEPPPADHQIDVAKLKSMVNLAIDEWAKG